MTETRDSDPEVAGWLGAGIRLTDATIDGHPNTSPPSPQAKHLKSFWSGAIPKDGVRSSWKGQSPVQRFGLVERRSSVYWPTRSTKSTASRTRSLEAWVYGPPETQRTPAAAADGKRDASDDRPGTRKPQLRNVCGG